MANRPITVLGIFVADLTFVADHFPAMAETVLGTDFRMGPGGKGSNQAVAARRAGGEVNLLAKVGADTFGDMARDLFAREGIAADHIAPDGENATGAASIYVDEATGENAIVVVPGASATITPEEVRGAEGIIAGSYVLMTQFEIAMPVVEESLRIARAHDVITILDPAPATTVGDDIYAMVDVLTPNEAEAAALSGLPVNEPGDAEAAADFFLEKGVGSAIITLGGAGARIKTAEVCVHLPALDAGPADATTGAGDAFNGALAVALSEGESSISAVRFANAAAALSVTRPGTAESMPTRAEIDVLLKA